MKSQTITILTGIMLLIPASFMLPACGGGGGGGGCIMYGTIANNSSIDLAGVTYTIGLDADTIMESGNEVAMFQAVWPGGATTDYVIDISSVPPGSYYVWVKVEVPGQYMIYGFYDGWTPVNQSGQVKPAPISCGTVIPLFMDIT